jgi:hypothetical protein
MKWILILAGAGIALFYVFGKELSGSSAPEGSSSSDLQEFENKPKPVEPGKEPSTAPE